MFPENIGDVLNKAALANIVAFHTSAVVPLGRGSCGAQNQTSICSLGPS
jgi:hypothetical protein